MGNHDHGLVLELFLHQLLDFLLGHDVDVRGGFIKDDDSSLSDDGSADAKKLLFST